VDFSNNTMNDKLYYSKTELAEGVGVSITTMKARATNIREALPEGSKFEADITYIYMMTDLKKVSEKLWIV